MNRNEIRIYDLGAYCQPQYAVSDLRERYKWNRIPYESNGGSGTMLVSNNEGTPQPVTLPLQASGWYKIYVGLPNYSWLPCQNSVSLRLTKDGAPMLLSPDQSETLHSIQEVYWRSADLTGQDLVISKHPEATQVASLLAWIRLVPMTEEEVAAYKADVARTDTKRLYATNDMHGMFYGYGPHEPEQWYGFVQDYADSDVEWLSMENIVPFDGDVSTGNTDNFTFPRDGDRKVQENLKEWFTPELLRKLVDYGHGIGLKMCESLRMGIWGHEFPFDQMCFDNHFMLANPQWGCVDRDGDSIYAMSYAYPEVQDYILDQFAMMAKTGCDAVEMMFHRGVPYVLFEPPFVERFLTDYGEDPRYLPLDDERIVALRCEIMTGFVRRLRAMLDEISPDRKIGLHARCLYSLHDSRLVGVDPETWAREGLITAVISYPQRIREQLPEDVWDANGRIDLDVYHRHVLEDGSSMIRRTSYGSEAALPEADSHGVLTGPADLQERIDQWMALEKQYGVTVYVEIMPRQMSPAEYQRRALELYDCGCGHISLWDTYGRVPIKRQWSMAGRLGHREELKDFDSGEGVFYRNYRITKIGDKDVARYHPSWGG